MLNRTLWNDGDASAFLDDDGSLGIVVHGHCIKLPLLGWWALAYRKEHHPIGELLDLGEVIAKAAREVH